MSATWRLRRCRLVEATTSPIDDAAVDRARSHAHNMLRRSLAELRKLQTERTIRCELEHTGFPGIADSRQVLAAIRAQHVIIANAPAQLPQPKGDDFSALDAFLARVPASSFCKIPEPASEIPEPTPGPEAQAESGPSQPDSEPSNTSAPPSSFCKIPVPIRQTPRSAPCPCGSALEDGVVRPYPEKNDPCDRGPGQCCGLNAPPVLNKAA